jgi:hypothetical protein
MLCSPVQNGTTRRLPTVWIDRYRDLAVIATAPWQAIDAADQVGCWPSGRDGARVHCGHRARDIRRRECMLIEPPSRIGPGAMGGRLDRPRLAACKECCLIGRRGDLQPQR